MKIKANLLNVSLCVLAFLAAGPSIFAQSSGTILGVVKDSSGAAVPAATVTVRNEATAQTRTTETGEDGAYRLPALQVGHYDVTVDKAGFKTETQTGLVLDVSQELSVNISLSVGASSEKITVTGEAPIVNTTTSSLGGVVDEKRISELPLNGRNYIDLSLLQTGVSKDYASGSGGGAAGTSFSSNGAPTNSNNVTLDGASMMNTIGTSVGSESGTTLGVDGIQEYKVITNSYAAEYGMTMGAQVQLVSKGGSNQFHGDAFEFFRNSSLDARNFFDPTVSILDGKRIPEFQRNNFGGAFGGPIKKDKTFFFGVFEGLTQNVGFSVHGDVVPPIGCHYEHGSTTVPLKPGDTVLATDCPLGSYIGSGGKNVTSATIPNNSSGMSALTLLNLYPLPNVGTNGYAYPAADLNSVQYGQMRVDQIFSDKDSAFVRYTIDNSSLNNANTSVVVGTGGTAFPEFREGAGSRNQFLSLSESHIFSTSVLNSARLSYSRTNFNVVNLYTGAPGGGTQSALPWGSLNAPQYQFVPGESVGSLSTTPYTTLGPPGNPGGPPLTYFIVNTYTFGDDLNYTRGKHAFKFGTLINRLNFPSENQFDSVGTVSFTSLAYLMNATPTSYAAATPGSYTARDWIFNTVGMYAQDDWRVTSRLTLNLGLRYEFFTAPYEKDGFGYAIQGDSDFHISPTATTGTKGPLFQPYAYKNFMPRIGLAWDVFGNGKTAIRSGFGIFSDIANFGSVAFQESTRTPPLSGLAMVSPPPTIAVPLTIPFNFNSPYLNTSSLYTENYNPKLSRTYQYNLTIEQQLPGNMSLTVAYVGLRGTELWTSMDGNPVIPTTVGGVNPTNPDGSINYNVLYGSGVQYYGFGQTAAEPRSVNCENVVPTCRINPNFSTMNYLTTGTNSIYNSVQVNVNKKLSSGLQFQAAYTYQMALDNTQGNQTAQNCSLSTGAQSGLDPLQINVDRAPTCFLPRQSTHFNMLYHFPTMGAGANKFERGALNGWWMGNIITVQSGIPFSVAMSGQRSQSGEAQRASYNTAASIAANPCTSLPGQTAAGANPCAYTPIPYDPNTVITGDPNHYFNPAMFSMPTVGFLGSAPRDFLWGPKLFTWDLSVVKDTHVSFLGESGNLQFRAEFFNLLNHANFANPLGTTFTGNPLDVPANAPYSEAPLSTVGLISSTITTSRQIQLALKIVF